jgi:uncharacterized membrane protein
LKLQFIILKNGDNTMNLSEKNTFFVLYLQPYETCIKLFSQVRLAEKNLKEEKNMGFTVGRLILISLGLLIFFGVAERVLDRMHLTDKQAFFALGAIILGSFINLTLFHSDILTVRINLGGALVPFALAFYVWIKAGTVKEKTRSIIGAVFTAAVIWFLGMTIGSEYALPVDILYLYPLIAGLAGYLAGRSRKGAFIAAVLGVLLFDVSHGVYLIYNRIPGLVHFGGGGIYDAVILSGILAVCLAEFIGEGRERMQGGPESRGRDESVLKNLRTAGGNNRKGGERHGERT